MGQVYLLNNCHHAAQFQYQEEGGQFELARLEALKFGRASDAPPVIHLGFATLAIRRPDRLARIVHAYCISLRAIV